MLTPLDLPCGDEPDPNTLGWQRGQLRSRDWRVPVPEARAAPYGPIARATRGHVGPFCEDDARRLDSARRDWLLTGEAACS